MLFLVILLYALFGLTFTLAKVTLWYASPFFIVAFRMIVGGMILSAYAWYKHRVRCLPSRQDFWLMVKLALFGIYIFYCARSWSLQYLSTTKAALLFNLSPFITALLSYILYKESLSRRKILGLMCGFIGMLPTLFSNADSELGIGSIIGISSAEIVFIGAVAALSYGMLLTQQLVKHHSCSPIIINAFVMSLGGSLALLTSWVLEPIPVAAGHWQEFLALMSLQVIISNLLCSNLQAYLLKMYTPTFMAFAGFLSPLSAALYGCIFLEERLTGAFVLSFVLVFIGLALFYNDELKKHDEKKPAVSIEEDDTIDITNV